MRSSRPLLAIALAFASGIWIAAQSFVFVFILVACVFLMAVCFGMTRRSFWLSLLLGAVFALFGSACYLLSTLVPANDVSQHAPAYLTLVGTVGSDVRAASGLRSGDPASGRFVLQCRGIVFQEDIQENIGSDVSASGEGAATQTGTQIVTVSGQVEARVPLAAVSLARRTPTRGRRRNGEQPSGSQLSSRQREAETSAETGPNIEPDVPHYGDTLLLRGRLEQPVSARNPGDFDYAAYLSRRGIHATITARRYADWKRIPKEGAFQLPQSPVMSLALTLRERVLAHGKRAHEPEWAGVLNGILLGDRGDLPGALNEDFERTGTSHVLATAGLHVGMVVVLLLGGLRFCRIAHRPGLLLAMAMLIVYALMAGGRPSVVRAVLMASVVLFGLLLEREPDLPNTLALAALVLLIVNPQNLFEPGFQFSFATVITIVLLMPLAKAFIANVGNNIPSHWPGASQLRRLLQTLATCFFLALASQVGAAPLAAYYYNSVSLIGLVANTLIVPLIALIIALGFGAALLASIHPILALPLDRTLDGLLTWVITIVRACSHAPYASFSMPSPPAWQICVYYVVLWGMAWFLQQTPHTKKADIELEVFDG